MCRTLLALALLFVAAPCFAADTPPDAFHTVTVGSLACFTIAPDVPLPGATRTPNCEELCAAQDAACTGVAVGAINPPPTCATRSITPTFVSCRCCAVVK